MHISLTLTLASFAAASALTVTTPTSALERPDDWKAIELFEVREAQPVQDDVLNELLERIAPGASLGSSTELHPSAYRAVINDPRAGGTIRVSLFMLPLSAPFEGGQLAAAIDEKNDVRALDLIGHPEFSKDDFTMWFTFLLQFLANPSMNTDEFRLAPLGSERPQNIEEFLNACAPEDRPLLGFLARQRHMMKRNRLLLFHLQQVLRSGQPVDPDWFRDHRRELIALMEESDVLESLLATKAVSDYRASAKSLARVLDVLTDSAQQGTLTMATLPARGKELSASCKSCHEAQSPTEGLSLQDYLSEKRTSAALPRGLLQIGYDVALAPGVRPAAGESVASGLRLALQLHAELQELTQANR